MAAVPTEKRVLNRLRTALDAITASPSLYLTAPTIGTGVPLDSVTTGDKPMLSADYVRTTVDREGLWGTAQHRGTVVVSVWVVAKDVDLLLNAKADVVRAIFAAESGFIGEFGAILMPTDFAVRDEMTMAGEYVGVQLAEILVEFSHAAP